jgi:hypothetical protein
MRALSVALKFLAAGSGVFLCAGLGALGCGEAAQPDAANGGVGSSPTLAGSAGGGAAGQSGLAGAKATAGSAGGSSTQAGRGAGGAGVGGAAGGGSAMGGAGAGRGGAGAVASGGADAGDSAAEAERFSFFLASQAGLARLSGNALGFGGDLRFGKVTGLLGADEICRQLADDSMPGNGKTWRAFLSVTKGPEGTPVNAIDRIGSGPWYDRLGRMFAADKAALTNTRPLGIDSKIANDLPNEDGVPNHDPGTGIVDNHNILTGSTAAGALDSQGLTATCQDWTNATSGGGKPRCGVSWPRSNLVHWIAALNEGGCAPGATPAGADSGARGTVGALGGYGGFYCFALTP